MIAILSDIHGNLEAFQAVLDFLLTKQIEKVYCLGDIVGYGANPVQVAEVIRHEKIQACLGNHDAAVIQKFSDAVFNTYAAFAISWTKNQLSANLLQWMNSLPYIFQDETRYFTHGSPEDPEAFYYLHSKHRANEAFKNFSEKVAFVGHTHIPLAFRDDGEHYYTSSLRLDMNYRYIVNVGSVGQPRDGDPRACVVLLDDNYVVSWVRIDYNVKAAADKIRSAGLPEYLASRLLIGK